MPAIQELTEGYQGLSLVLAVPGRAEDILTGFDDFGQFLLV